MRIIRKIVLIGPESTGKTMLSKLLAEYYHSIWVPEYAREYLEEHGMAYSFEDLLTIAKGQLTLEESFQTTIIEQQDFDNKPVNFPGLLFIDTDMYVMKVWCEFVFGKCHQWILDQIATRSYDLYLLCDIDLPWKEEPLREYPDLEPRERLFHIYKDLLINQDTKWVLIKGDYEERLRSAIDAVDKLIAANS